MNNQAIAQRLKDLDLHELIPDIEGEGAPYPLPKRRIIRLLEVAATKYPDRSTEIMALHHDILHGDPR